MTLFSTNEMLQLGAWFLALVSFILALYILLLNVRHIANRHVSALFLVIALDSLAVGLIVGAQDAAQAALPSLLLAITSPTFPPLALLIAVILLKPDWRPHSGPQPGPATGRGCWRRLWWPVYGLIVLPALLTLVDVGLGSQLWYTGLEAQSYTGGYVSLFAFAAGSLSTLIRVVYFFGMSVAILALALYVAVWDKTATRLTRRLAWLLVGLQVAGMIVELSLRALLDPALKSIIVASLYTVTYAYAAFQQMISERRLQRGRLRVRLTALILAATVPLLVAVVASVSIRAGAMLEQRSSEQLAATNRALAATVTTWLELNLQALDELVSLPDIVSMDAGRQKPILEAMADAFPHIYLVSTTDLDGINVARNDDVASKDYSDRPWFQGARDGAPVTFQSLIGRTSGEPALVASMPIRDAANEIVGVGMWASDLTDLAAEVQVSTVGETGFAYVVDAQNRVIAHPDPAFSSELRDLSDSPPIVALRQGERGLVTFTDEEGQRWRAYVDELEYGWGVVVQQPEAEALKDLGMLWTVAGVVIAAGTMILSVLTWLTIRQAFHPLSALTDTAAAIAAGDLTRVAPVQSEDEIGDLAQVFNSMTAQLRELIGSLEQQVADRTRDLASRSAHLEAAAEVSRAAVSILETEQLLWQVAALIQERFDLHHVGLFMVDKAHEWAEYRAGAGAAEPLFDQGLRLEIGGPSLIGWVTANAQPRVAQDVEQETGSVGHPLTPETRAEAALPLIARERVIGAISVQSERPGAFDPDTLTALQIVADQVAVSLDNARLFAESQAALEAERRAYGEFSRRAWAEMLRPRLEWGYRYARQTVTPVEGDWRPDMLQARQTGRTVRPVPASPAQNGGPGGGDGAGRPTLAIPLKVRGEVVGVLGFRKDEAEEAWTTEELELLEALAARLELALEGARLYQDAQRRAARERLLGEVTARLRQTLDVEMVLRTAAQEVQRALGLPEVVVRLAGQPTGR